MTTILLENSFSACFSFILAPSRGDFFPLLAVLIPLVVLSLLVSPFFYFTKKQKIKKIAGIYYKWLGLITSILGIGLIIVPLILIGVLIYQFLSDTAKPLTLVEYIWWGAVWFAIPGVPLILGSLLLRVSNAIAPETEDISTRRDL